MLGLADEMVAGAPLGRTNAELAPDMPPTPAAAAFGLIELGAGAPPGGAGALRWGMRSRSPKSKAELKPPSPSAFPMPLTDCR